MTTISQAQRDEIETNYKAISAQMDALMLLHSRKYALMRDGEIVEFYANHVDAYKTGRRFYEDGRFSVQEVTKTPVDLGHFSHAVHSGSL